MDSGAVQVAWRKTWADLLKVGYISLHRALPCDLGMALGERWLE